MPRTSSASASKSAGSTFSPARVPAPEPPPRSLGAFKSAMRKSKAKNAEIATANTPQIHLFLISLLNF